MDEEQEITAFRVERQADGSILLTAGDDSYALSEDDCAVLARGLQAVVLNNPPELTVHLESDERSAYLEYA